MAPTKLGQIGYRRFDHQNKGSRAAGAGLTPSVNWLRGPWPGYEPDMSATQATPGAAKEVISMMDREGVLTQQNGFARVDSTRLPLGDTTPPAVTGEPVIGIFEGHTKSTQAIRRYFVTGNTAGGGYGHLYELASGVWTYRAFSGVAADNIDTDADIASTLFDGAHYTAADYTVFASGQVNPLYRMPRVGNANEFEILGGLGSIGTLGANSVVSSEERLHAFGTYEAGSYKPTTWRWTSKGANGQFDPTLTGAGFVDISELGGEALAIRNIGTKIALYTTKGVQFARRTSQTTDPFAKDYTTYERGLLSTNSIVNIGGGVHFGLFTDGWFMLRYDGMWEERGMNDKGYHKWRREFYGTLDWTNRKRIVAEYDENDHLVYIGFPQTGATGNGPSMVWVYDIMRDTCWPAPNWQFKPNIFRSITEEARVGALWSDFSTTPWANGSGSWGSYEAQTGQRRIMHGTDAGLVFYHHPALVTQDSLLPGYLYKTHYFYGAQLDQFKQAEAIHINYTRLTNSLGGEPSPVSVSLENNNGVLRTGSIKQTQGADATEQVDFVSPGIVSGTALRFTLSGATPVKISGVAVQIQGTSGEVRKEDSV